MLAVFILFTGSATTAAALSVSVNYTEGNVWGTTDPLTSVEVWHTDFGGSPIDSATASADSNGHFSVHRSEWISAGCSAAIDPGDKVYAVVGTSTASVTVGIIDVTTDPILDQATGTLQAGWLTESVTIFCVLADPYFLTTTTADPGGGSFTCNFPNIQPGDVVNVGYEEPDGDQVWVTRRVPKLIDAMVNYGLDQIFGIAPPGSEISVTLKDSGDSLKATAQVTADTSGNFEVLCSDWSNSVCPDIVAGDVVVLNGGGYNTLVEVGTIDGAIDFSSDTISGTITAPFSECLILECIIHEETAPPITQELFSQQGNYSCDWTGDFDLQTSHLIEVRYNEPDGDSVSTVFVEPKPYLLLKNLEALGNAGEGGNLAFTVSYSNHGNAPAEDTEINMTLHNMTYIYDTSGFPITTKIVPEGQQVTWNVGSLYENQDISFRVYVSVDGAFLDILSATAEIITSNPFDQGALSEKQKKWQGIVGAYNISLNVAKHSWTPDPAPGTDFVWEVKVCNSGTTSSSGITLTDIFPTSTDINFIEWWTCVPGWIEIGASAEELSLYNHAIADNACSSINLKFHVAESAFLGTSLINSAEIIASGDFSGGAEATDEIIIGQPHANLTIDKSLQNGQLTPGGELQYMIQYRNTGNIPIKGYLDNLEDPVGLAVIDILPPQLTFVDAKLIKDCLSSQLIPIGLPPEYSWLKIFSVPDLENGYQGQIVLTAIVNQDTQPGTELTNSAEICLHNFTVHECISPPLVEDAYEDNFSLDTQVIQRIRSSKGLPWLILLLD
jgi:uncharacterized repeat protein (TIGR01451 family)